MSCSVLGYTGLICLCLQILSAVSLALDDEYAESLGGWMQQLPGDATPSPAERGVLAEANDLLRQLRFSEAGTLLLQAQNRFPESRFIQYMLASVYITGGKQREAIQLLEKLLVQYPNDVRLINNLSWVLSTAVDPALRNPSRALVLAQDAVLLAPENNHMWSTLAEAHFVNANYEQGMKALQQGIDLAVHHNIDAGTLRTYQKQMKKLREAASVMSLIEQ